MGAGSRAVNTTHGVYSLVWETRRNKRKQIPFQMVLEAYAGETLRDMTETTGRRLFITGLRKGLSEETFGQGLLK